jgi:hypothetical protein
MPNKFLLSILIIICLIYSGTLAYNIFKTKYYILTYSIINKNTLVITDAQALIIEKQYYYKLNLILILTHIAYDRHINLKFYDVKFLGLYEFKDKNEMLIFTENCNNFLNYKHKNKSMEKI